MPYLKNDDVSSANYALGALYIMCQISALSTPRGAHRLTWNRFFKTNNGTGGNVPLDLALKHYNRVIKMIMRNLGPNASNPKASSDRYCKALVINKKLLESFDVMTNFMKRSGEHFRRSEQSELRKIVIELVKNKALTLTPGPQYQHFCGISDSLLSGFDIDSFQKKVQLKKCAR